jgi:hypothetical protein
VYLEEMQDAVVYYILIAAFGAMVGALLASFVLLTIPCSRIILSPLELNDEIPPTVRP